MQLEQWRRSKDLTYAQLADLLALSNATAARRYCTGERIPEDPMKVRIFRVTDGLVTPSDLLGLPDPAAPPPATDSCPSHEAGVNGDAGGAS